MQTTSRDKAAVQVSPGVSASCSCETLRFDARVRCSTAKVLHFLHQGDCYCEAFKVAWHHFPPRRCFWVAGISCLLAAELTGTRQCLRKVSNTRSCCSTSQHFVSKRLINRYPIQFNDQSIGLQKPLRRYLHS